MLQLIVKKLLDSISGETLVKELERLEKKKAKIARFIEENNGLDMQIESEAQIADDLKSIDKTINTLKGVLS